MSNRASSTRSRRAEHRMVLTGSVLASSMAFVELFAH